MELWSSANPLYLVEQQSDTGELLRAEFSVVQNYVRGNSLQQHSKQSAATFQTVCSNVPNSLQRRSKQSAATFQTVCSDVPNSLQRRSKQSAATFHSLGICNLQTAKDKGSILFIKQGPITQFRSTNY